MHLADDLLQYLAGLLLEAALGATDHLAELIVGHSGDDGFDLGCTQHILGLALELRLGDAYRDHGHQPSQDIVALHLSVRVLEVDLEAAGIGLHGLAHLTGHGVHEPVHVHASAGCLYHIDEATDD